MEERTQVVIDIQLDEADVAQRLSEVNWEMANIKQSNKELREEIKKGNDDYSENSKKLAENEAKLKSLQAEQKALSGQVAQAAQKTREYGTSLKEQAAKLNDLRNRYQSLDETQRNSRGGQKMLKEIKELDKAMKEADAQQGIFGRNVGDYANKMAEAMEKAGVKVGGLKSKFDLLNKNPIMFTLGLIVGLLVKLKDRVQQSEKATASLQKDTKSLQPVMEALGKIVDWLANLFSHALDWAIKGIIESVGWLGRTIQKVGKIFGKDWGGQLIETAEQMKKNVQTTEEVTEKTEELGDAMTTATKAVKDYNDAVAQTNEGLSRLKETIEGMPDMKKAMGLDRNDNLIEQWRKEMKAAEDAAKKMAEDAKVIQWRMEQIFGKQGVLSDDFMERLERDSNPLYNFAQSFKENAKDIEAVSSSLQSAFGSMSSIYKQLSEDETKSEEERAKAARAARRWALAQVAANSAVALSKSIAEAASAGPWPANMAAIASSVATVLAMIAQAKALLNEGGGSGTTSTASFTSYGGGSQAAVNGNGNQQMQSVADGQQNGTYVSQLAQIVGGMPAPVLVYSELRNFEDSVVSMNESQIIH